MSGEEKAHADRYRGYRYHHVASHLREVVIYITLNKNKKYIYTILI